MYVCAYIMYVCIHVWLYVCTCIHIRMYALIEMIMVVGKLSRREYIILKTGEKYSPEGICPGGKCPGEKCPVETVRFPAHCTCIQGRTSHRGMKQKIFVVAILGEIIFGILGAKINFLAFEGGIFLVHENLGDVLRKENVNFCST